MQICVDNFGYFNEFLTHHRFGVDGSCVLMKHDCRAGRYYTNTNTQQEQYDKTIRPNRGSSQ